MVSVKVQIEELEKPNSRFVLELHIIRVMIQDADNMDKGLKDVLQRMQTHVMRVVPSTPQPSPALYSPCLWPRHQPLHVLHTPHLCS